MLLQSSMLMAFALECAVKVLSGYSEFVLAWPIFCTIELLIRHSVHSKLEMVFLPPNYHVCTEKRLARAHLVFKRIISTTITFRTHFRKLATFLFLL